MARVSLSSPAAFSAPDYMNHLIGLVSLLSWRSRWEEISYLSPLVTLSGPVMELGLVASQRFVLGFPQRGSVYGKKPFLAIQPEETQFFSRLRWSKAFVSVSQRRLLLVTQKVMGDDDSLEDLPSMGFAIEFDDERKLQWLLKFKGLNVRKLWFDEDGHHVTGGKPLVEMPLRALADGESPFPNGALSQARTLRDMIGDKLERTNRLYLNFEGIAPSVPQEFREMVSEFDPKAVPSVRPS